MAKKSKAKHASKSETASLVNARQGMDQIMASVQRLLMEKDFASAEEANAYLQQLLKDNGGQLPILEPETPLERAQALVDQAYGLTNPTRQRALARQALEMAPDCADAYMLLASLAPDLPQRLALMEQAVAAGQRALGEAEFKELEGHFWGFVQTRPFMAAYAGFAELSWALGDRARAITIYTDMLRLNPGDNQGVRYLLATSLLEERSPEARSALQELLGRYPDDSAANWAYNRALLAFQLQGQATPEANQALRAALKVNPHVPAYMLGEKPLPRELPEFIGMGDPNEAMEYVAAAYDAWRHTSGALPWLRSQRQA
jgi:tetratricopeptide (TPR) repeat protein